MHRGIFLACLPYVTAILVSVLVLRLLVALSGARLQLRRLKRLHEDQLGGVQSLSFVLTVPIFMIIMLFIVQLSQITIAKIVVEYAAFAAARAAIVWMPANVGSFDYWQQGAEPANCIGGGLIRLGYADDAGDWARYVVAPSAESRKYQTIHRAAAMACMPICPSRDLDLVTTFPLGQIEAPLEKAYFGMAPSQEANPRVPARLRNKLAYALENTAVRIEIRHNEAADPPLYDVIGGCYEEHPSDIYYDEYIDMEFYEFAPNEIGFQDQVLVTVVHDFALLPGPFGFLRRQFDWLNSQFVYHEDSEASYGASPLTPGAREGMRAFVHAVKATVRLTSEGEKSVVPYVQGVSDWFHGSGPPHRPPNACACQE